MELIIFVLGILIVKSIYGMVFYKGEKITKESEKNDEKSL